MLFSTKGACSTTTTHAYIHTYNTHIHVTPMPASREPSAAPHYKYVNSSLDMLQTFLRGHPPPPRVILETPEELVKVMV